MENKLNSREQLFCLYYCQSRSPRLAAAQAGYGIFTQKNAAKLMKRKSILNEIERLDSQTPPSGQEIISGYRQLAFGSVADALKLLFADEKSFEKDFETLELLNVSEIKRAKTGGIEIKFFDRIKALEGLNDVLSQGVSDSALPFYNVIEKSAAILKDDSDVE